GGPHEFWGRVIPDVHRCGGGPQLPELLVRDPPLELLDIREGQLRVHRARRDQRRGERVGVVAEPDGTVLVGGRVLVEQLLVVALGHRLELELELRGADLLLELLDASVDPRCLRRLVRLAVLALGDGVRVDEPLDLRQEVRAHGDAAGEPRALVAPEELTDVALGHQEPPPTTAWRAGVRVTANPTVKRAWVFASGWFISGSCACTGHTSTG